MFASVVMPRHGVWAFAVWNKRKVKWMKAIQISYIYLSNRSNSSPRTHRRDESLPLITPQHAARTSLFT